MASKNLGMINATKAILWDDFATSAADFILVHRNDTDALGWLARPAFLGGAPHSALTIDTTTKTITWEIFIS